MTWRRFMVLVRGLGPESATVTTLNSTQYVDGKPVREVRTEQQAEDALARFFHRPSAKVN